jgi:hypothetical protein
MSRWERISLELSHTWPGEIYLRFQAADGTATMVRVDEDDLTAIVILINGQMVSCKTEADESAAPAEVVHPARILIFEFHPMPEDRVKAVCDQLDGFTAYGGSREHVESEVRSELAMWLDPGVTMEFKEGVA